MKSRCRIDTERAQEVSPEIGRANNLGAQVRFRRKAVGWTQARLAHAIDVSPQQLQKYETGKNSISPRRLLQICDALKLPLDFFTSLERTRLLVASSRVDQEQQAFPGPEPAERFLASAEGERLVRSFSSIGDRVLRTRLLDFIVSLSSRDRA